MRINQHKKMPGRVFTRLTVLEEAGSNKHRQKLWKCQCTCGNTIVVSTNSLTSNNTKSCGCLNNEVIYSGSESPEYKSYHSAKQRCTNPSATHYDLYGERGIKFLFNSFKEFYEELGPRPIGYTLDRIDPDGNYEVGNVRWATTQQQIQNRRPFPHPTARTFDYEGRTLKSIDIAAALGISQTAVSGRVALGWCVSCIVEVPKFGSCPHRKH